VLVAAGVTGAAVAGVFGSSGSPGRASGGPGVATRVVEQRTLVSQTTLNATLEYAGSFTVKGGGGGALTWLPPVGPVIGQGGVLWRVDNAVPVILLYGKVPLWRALAEKVTGQDVAQLNHDLVAWAMPAVPISRRWAGITSAGTPSTPLSSCSWRWG
jgi:hypothetical protein